MIVLDTHVLVWWAGDASRIPARIAALIERELQDGGVTISSISAWEIAMLVAKGRLNLAMDVSRWLELAASIPGLSFVPVDNRIAVSSVTLPGDLHADPADRIIVALARDLGCRLVSADEKLRSYAAVETVW